LSRNSSFVGNDMAHLLAVLEGTSPVLK